MILPHLFAAHSDAERTLSMNELEAIGSDKRVIGMGACLHDTCLHVKRTRGLLWQMRNHHWRIY